MDKLKAILDTPMSENDADARTVREYFALLAAAVWHEGEGFYGKRPFGNSGWESEVTDALDANHITYDDDLIKQAIKSMGTPWIPEEPSELTVARLIQKLSQLPGHLPVILETDSQYEPTIVAHEYQVSFGDCVVLR